MYLDYYEILGIDKMQISIRRNPQISVNKNMPGPGMKENFLLFLNHYSAEPRVQAEVAI
jgi:hypothetical protein